MKNTFTLIALLIFGIVSGQNTASKNALANFTFNKSVENEIDAIFKQAFPDDSPGATVLIAQNGNVIYRKAFGLANLELNVPMKPENVLQLASITKQFTSVAILQLMEQGKLSLQDPISTFVADYPRGNEIRVHHLLNHTSGIKDYTRIAEFRTKTRLDMTPEEIIGSFKNLPLEFSPNEKYAYTNSGYVLLGYIIEKVSGLTYEEFIQKHIFDKLGMKNSHFGNSYRIIPNRASGYQFFDGNYENADYMSPTIPYAAGSLMSTIDDMFLWHQAIHNNTLISSKSKQLAFTNYPLNNGKFTNYGYGWYINEIAGLSTLEHTGGINGFTTSGIYIPDNSCYAIVLSNKDDGKGAEMCNLKAVFSLLGKPIVEKTAQKISKKQLEKWVGAYRFEDVVRFIIYEDGNLFSMREGGRPMKLLSISEHEFRFEHSLATYKFIRQNGKRIAFYSDRINKSFGTETNEKLPSDKVAISLLPEIMNKYVGVYELQPSFLIEIEKQNDRIFAKTGGQQPVELFAETENSFFMKEINAQLVFYVDSNGIVKSVIFSQGGNKMEGKKIL